MNYKTISKPQIKDLLEQKYEEYNVVDFVDSDPICIPHKFTKKQDIEIMGLWASLLAWGQRKTIINKCKELVSYMDGVPHDFIMNHQESDLKRFLNFKHRTFNATDTLFFLSFFKNYYTKADTLEDLFSVKVANADTIELGLVNFYNSFFSWTDIVPKRTRKHIASPSKKSACKRLNMFLRWMVRKDSSGVDFGIWEKIKPEQLVCPLDVHVERVARNLGLLKRKQTDWLAALELTKNLRRFDTNDPVKYDFALFGLGLEGF